jgi:hypothetical protein
MKEQMTEFEKKKALKNKAEGEDIGSASTKKAKGKEEESITVPKEKAKERVFPPVAPVKARAKVKAKAMVKTIAEEVATIEARSKGSSKSGVSTKGVTEVVATVTRKKKEIDEVIAGVKADGEQIAKKSKISPDLKQRMANGVDELIAKYTVANDAMNASKGSKLKKAKEAATKMDEVVAEVVSVKRKQEEILATSKVSKGSGDNRYEKKDPPGEKKEAEPKQKTAHPGKGSGAKLEKGKGGNDRATRQMSKSEKIEHWNGRGVQEIRNKLSQLGKVIPRSQLTGPNALKKADLLKVLHPML